MPSKNPQCPRKIDNWPEIYPEHPEPADVRDLLCDGLPVCAGPQYEPPKNLSNLGPLRKLQQEFLGEMVCGATIKPNQAD